MQKFQSEVFSAIILVNIFDFGIRSVDSTYFSIKLILQNLSIILGPGSIDIDSEDLKLIMKFDIYNRYHTRKRR